MNGFNFTPDVRRALTHSREAANELQHPYVGTEHVLLGILKFRECAACKILVALSVNPDELRTTLESIIQKGSKPAEGPDLPYTSRAKKTLELAMVVARDQRDAYVGTEHLLVGLIREGRGIAAQVLADVGVTADTVFTKWPTGSRESPLDASTQEWREELMPARRPSRSSNATLEPVTASSTELRVLLGVGAIALVASGIGAHEPGTWVLEVFPILLGVPMLIATRRRFPLTPLVYRLIFVHALILMLGAHYTYARVPLGFWIQDAFNFARNHYDRIGHFAQGFVPAMIAREILLRTSPLRPGKWLVVLVTCVCLSVSVSYEFIEWAAALIGGSSAEAFLGTQGDVWDTQWDMFMALLGALSAQLMLARVHDRQLTRQRVRPPLPP